MIEPNRIYCGDNVKVMQDIPDESIDLTVTSPPYDKLRIYQGYSFDFARVAQELYRITKKGGVVVWVVGDATIKGSESGTSFRQALHFKEIGFNLHDTMIYAKNSYMPLTHNRYEQAFDYMFAFSKGKPNIFNAIKIPSVTAGTTRNRGGSKAKEVTYSERVRNEKTVVSTTKQHPNIFYYDVGKNDKTEHNAPFPERLANDHILSWSNEGDIVLDPFNGSGTTTKMAKKNNRKFIGIDISQQYCDNAMARLEM